MFDYLNGVVIRTENALLILENNGIGYEIHIPQRLVGELSLGSEQAIYLHEYISESEHTLYGFKNRLSKIVFRQLIAVSGIGPKLAIRFLDRFTAEEVLHIVSNKNLPLLREVKGLGAKTGEKLIIELQKKSRELLHDNELTEPVVSITSDSEEKNEILAILANLGYRENQVRKTVEEILSANKSSSDSPTSEEVIKKVLEQLAKLK